jgi:hypothetical protein
VSKIIGRIGLEKHICPHCERPGITTLKKALMGPATTRKCSECGNAVSLHAKYFYAILFPLLLIIVSTAFIDNRIYVTMALVLSPITALILNDRFVPIEKR